MSAAELGELMSAILKKYPSMRGIVFDLPHSAEVARKNLGTSGAADRCEFIGGSVFESVPAGAEAIVMKSIICDWNDERFVRILQNCHRELKPGARLMVIDRIVPEKLDATPHQLATMLMDLNMLRIPGRMRTDEERASRAACQIRFPHDTRRSHRPLQCNRGGIRMIRQCGGFRKALLLGELCATRAAK
jgi:hypothetical protein